jgi:outer membrane protein
VPRVELLKTEVELAHARQAALITKNNLESAYELLKTLMGIDEPERTIVIVRERIEDRTLVGAIEKSLEKAFLQRPDYSAAAKRLKIAEERVALAEGKSLPAASVHGEYAGRSGEEPAFKENWVVALRSTMLAALRKARGEETLQ